MLREATYRIHIRDGPAPPGTKPGRFSATAPLQLHSISPF